MSITVLDVILLLVMLVSGLLAMMRGLSREVLSIGSWIAAAAAAYYFYPRLSPLVGQYTVSISDSRTLADIAAGVLILIVVLIVVSLFFMKIADIIGDSRVGPLDRSLGFLFGLARGVLIVLMPLLIYCKWIAPEEKQQPKWIAEAKSKPILDSIGNAVVQIFPDNLKRLIIDNNLTKSYQQSEKDI